MSAPLDDVPSRTTTPGPTLLVDAANVVGSRPDGWWRDRAGATRRLLDSLASASEGGFPGEWFGASEEATLVQPRVVVVLEGAARAAAPAPATAPPPAARWLTLEIVLAPASGDDEIVAAAERLVAEGAAPLVVATADRGLRSRLPASALSLGPGTLRTALEG